MEPCPTSIGIGCALARGNIVQEAKRGIASRSHAFSEGVAPRGPQVMAVARSTLLVLFCLVAVSVRSGEAACTFLIPSTTNSSLCDRYDLSKIAVVGGANITSDYSYVLTICEDLPASSLPLVCRSKQPAPAYQYDHHSCHFLGKLSSPFAVS